MTLGRWFALVVGGLVLAALLGLVGASSGCSGRATAATLLVHRVIPAETLAGDIATALLDQETSVRGFLLAGDERYLEPYREGRRAERRALAELQRLQDDDDLAGLRDDQAEIERRADAWRAHTRAGDRRRAGRRRPAARTSSASTLRRRAVRDDAGAGALMPSGSRPGATTCRRAARRSAG